MPQGAFPIPDVHTLPCSHALLYAQAVPRNCAASDSHTLGNTSRVRPRPPRPDTLTQNPTHDPHPPNPRYALNRAGEVMPWSIIADGIKATHPYEGGSSAPALLQESRVPHAVWQLRCTLLEPTHWTQHTEYASKGRS